MDKIDLVEILKDCPIGTELYCTLCGPVKFKGIDKTDYPISLSCSKSLNFSLTRYGKYWYDAPNGECLLFPSIDCSDWTNFTKKFDPKTLQPFDRVLVRHKYGYWKCGLFSHFDDEESEYKCICVGSEYCYCIPYNEETKHLVGTSDEAPEFYRYWED